MKISSIGQKVPKRNRTIEILDLECVLDHVTGVQIANKNALINRPCWICPRSGRLVRTGKTRRTKQKCNEAKNCELFLLLYNYYVKAKDA